MLTGLSVFIRYIPEILHETNDPFSDPLLCAVLLSPPAARPKRAASRSAETETEQRNRAAAEGISMPIRAVHRDLRRGAPTPCSGGSTRRQTPGRVSGQLLHELRLSSARVRSVHDGVSVARARRADNLDAAQTSLRETFPRRRAHDDRAGTLRGGIHLCGQDLRHGGAARGKCQWDCDGLTGAIRVRAYIDGELTEFTEFVPPRRRPVPATPRPTRRSSSTSRGEITALWHAHRISEPAQGLFPGDMRLMSLAEQDFFPGEGASFSGTDWITGDADAQYVITLQNGEMVYTGKISQDLVDQDGNRTGIVWQDIAPITLLA